jgi:hypothetical protein
VPALATPTQLGLLLKEPIGDVDPSALLMLDTASGMVRDCLQIGDIEAVSADRQLFDPINGAFVFLDQLPVTAVTLVETFDGTTWTTADPTTYTVSKRLGIISALPGLGVTWPTNPETWRVTYDHGFTQIPSSILGVVLGVAARAWTNPENLAAETFGPHQVRYQMQASGFTALEAKTLSHYASPRAA